QIAELEGTVGSLPNYGVIGIERCPGRWNYTPGKGVSTRGLCGADFCFKLHLAIWPSVLAVVGRTKWTSYSRRRCVIFRPIGPVRQIRGTVKIEIASCRNVQAAR